jgi:hypothetical protein
MWAAYLFTLLALIDARSAFTPGDKIVIVAWIAQTFLELSSYRSSLAARACMRRRPTPAPRRPTTTLTPYSTPRWRPGRHLEAQDAELTHDLSPRSARRTRRERTPQAGEAKRHWPEALSGVIVAERAVRTCMGKDARGLQSLLPSRA